MAGTGSSSICIPNGDAPRVISHRGSARYTNERMLCLWKATTTMAAVTPSYLRVARPSRRGSNIFWSTAGAPPHCHFLGHSFTIIPVYSGRRPWWFRK